jgi:hypothetical protein
MVIGRLESAYRQWIRLIDCVAEWITAVFLATVNRKNVGIEEDIVQSLRLYPVWYTRQFVMQAPPCEVFDLPAPRGVIQLMPERRLVPYGWWQVGHLKWWEQTSSRE